MKNESNIKHITIGKMGNKKNEFIAFFKHEFLGSTFSVCFKDNVMGAVALHSFIEMIQERYSNTKMKLIINHNNLNIKTEHILTGLAEKEQKNDIR